MRFAAKVVACACISIVVGCGGGSTTESTPPAAAPTLVGVKLVRVQQSAAGSMSTMSGISIKGVGGNGNGNQQQFEMVGEYSDGQLRAIENSNEHSAWNSTTPIAEVTDNGVVTIVKAEVNSSGVVTASATIDNVPFTGSLTVRRYGVQFVQREGGNCPSAMSMDMTLMENGDGTFSSVEDPNYTVLQLGVGDCGGGDCDTVVTDHAWTVNSPGDFMSWSDQTLQVNFAARTLSGHVTVTAPAGYMDNHECSGVYDYTGEVYPEIGQ